MPSVAKLVNPRPFDLRPEQRAYYADVSTDQSARRSVLKHYIPRETGYAFRVDCHQVLRITCCDGPQVADFNCFSRTDPSEHFWSGRTRTMEGAHITAGNRLWGTEPKMRPMFTFITDTVEHKKLPYNAASHDLIFARCSERAKFLQFGEHRPNCNTNYKRALQAIGFSDQYVHDSFNIFCVSGYDEDHRLFFLAPDAKLGDYVELYAEIDNVVAISCCPGICNGEGGSKRLEIEVFDQPRRFDAAKP